MIGIAGVVDHRIHGLSRKADRPGRIHGDPNRRIGKSIRTAEHVLSAPSVDTEAHEYIVYVARVDADGVDSDRRSRREFEAVVIDSVPTGLRRSKIRCPPDHAIA